MNRTVSKLKIKHKIQDGKIIYSDLNMPAKPLFSKRYRISGKPDYIIKKDGHRIPVEVKTGQHYEPKKNHVFQLAAYCQILEENYGGFVPYGILVYNDTSQQYKIPFDPKIRFELESAIKKMRHILKTNKTERNHNDLYKCRSCSMRNYCNKKIA
jgi:CRISPR-associated exonuclease Cas4